MLSSNLLKSKIPISGRGGRGKWSNQLSTFDAEFKFAEIQNSYVWEGGGGWWSQLSHFDAEFKFAKIQNSHFWGGGVGGTNFQLWMLSSNLLRSKIPISRGGGWWNQLSTFDAEFKFAKIQNSISRGGGWWNQLSTFDAKLKFAEIQNSHFWGRGGTNFQLLMLSSNLLKSKIPISGRGGRGEWSNQLSTFDAEFKFAEIQNSILGGGGLVEPTFNFWCWVQIC